VILKNTEVVVIWGADPINTNQIAWGVAYHESYIYFRKLKEQMKKARHQSHHDRSSL
jgi:trimethylamiNe-n-oxide reductase 2